MRTDGHLSVVSSPVLADVDLTDAAGIELGEDGKPTGRLTKEANRRASVWIESSYGSRLVEEFQLQAAGLAASRGVTAVHEMSMDLTDLEVLVKAAADVGMDPDKTRDLLASDADVEKIESMANSAKDAGIDGVPTFILGGVAAVTGAQSPEVLANAIEQIAVNREQFLAEQRKAASA